MCTIDDFKNLKLHNLYRNTLKEELEEWHAYYLPIKNPKVVVDIGAGEGESVQFFLNHGAEKVIAIEGDEEAFKMLEENFKDNPKVICIKAMIDIIKIDCEGCEKGLVFEAHNLRPKIVKHIMSYNLPVDIYQMEKATPSDFDFEEVWKKSEKEEFE